MFRLRKLFDIVRDDVWTATRHVQQPFTYGSPLGREIFISSPGSDDQACERRSQVRMSCAISATRLVAERCMVAFDCAVTRYLERATIGVIVEMIPGRSVATISHSKNVARVQPTSLRYAKEAPHHCFRVLTTEAALETRMHEITNSTVDTADARVNEVPVSCRKAETLNR
jgi:hypothetical protein